MAIENGIAITIRAFLHTGKTLDEQFAALTMMKEAHETGDYSKVLATAQIDEIKAEPKSRRTAAEVAAAPAPVKADDGGTDDDLEEEDDAIGVALDAALSDLPDDIPTEEPALQAAE